MLAIQARPSRVTNEVKSPPPHPNSAVADKPHPAAVSLLPLHLSYIIFFIIVSSPRFSCSSALRVIDIQIQSELHAFASPCLRAPTLLTFEAVGRATMTHEKAQTAETNHRECHSRSPCDFDHPVSIWRRPRWTEPARRCWAGRGPLTRRSHTGIRVARASRGVGRFHRVVSCALLWTTPAWRDGTLVSLPMTPSGPGGPRCAL